MRRYVLLARHGAVDHDPGKPDSDQKLANGGQDIRQVAARLVEHLQVQPHEEPIVIGQIWHGSYRQVRETTAIYEKMLEDHAETFRPKQKVGVVRVCRALNPDVFWEAVDEETRHRVGEWLLKGEGAEEHQEPFEPRGVSPDQSGPKPNAILVIGHAPHVGWTAEKVLGSPLPIDRAEVARIAIDQSLSWLQRLWEPDRWLLWTIGPSDVETMEDLRDKIDSKMKLAGILGGLITGLLSLLLGSLLDPEGMKALTSTSGMGVYVASALFLIALGLYLATVYAYDRLLMPTRFWAEKAARQDRRWLVQRPPSSAAWVLYQNMIRVWKWLFTPATWAVIGGILVLAHAVFHPPWYVVVLILPLLVSLAWYYRRFRPVLGTED